jgi:hypothetical protein
MAGRSAFPEMTMQTEKPPKRAGMAIALAVLFGPLGLFYASTLGGVVMCMVTVTAGLFTVGVALVPCWLVCVFWAVVATVSHDDPHPTGIPWAEAQREDERPDAEG